jgi:hypothetical protein
LRWLSASFGEPPFRSRSPLLPTRDEFPELWNGASLQLLYERICGHLSIDPARVPLVVANEERRFELVDDRGHAASDRAGCYSWDEDGECIRLQATQVGDPISLIGTLAHELSHARLLGEGRVSGDEIDHELLTDLCAVHHGFGVFLANSPRAWLADCGRWPGTELVRPEYMTVHLHAWALAHCALLAGEQDPRWLNALQSEPRRLVRDGIHVLATERDSAFLTGDWSAWEALERGLDPARHEAREAQG